MDTYPKSGLERGRQSRNNLELNGHEGVRKLGKLQKAR
jgi:hypothetical protein